MIVNCYDAFYLWTQILLYYILYSSMKEAEVNSPADSDPDLTVGDGAQMEPGANEPTVNEVTGQSNWEVNIDPTPSKN